MYIYIHMYQETWTQGCDGWCRQLHNQLAGAMPMPNFTTQWQSNFASPIAALGCLLWMGKKNAPPKMDWFHGSRIATYCFGCIDLPHFSNCGMSWRSIIEHVLIPECWSPPPPLMVWDQGHQVSRVGFGSDSAFKRVSDNCQMGAYTHLPKPARIDLSASGKTM